MINASLDYRVDTMIQTRGFLSKLCHMPSGFWAVYALQIFATMSYAVLYATLVLYMKNKLGMSAQNADIITGVFLALNFTLHMFAGVIGGQLLSYRTILLISIPLQIIGNIILSQASAHSLYLGLALMLTGTGTMTTCINMLLSQLFQAQDERRELGFLVNYSGMNIGFFIGFALAGYFQIHENYGTLFSISAVGSAIALAILLFFWRLWYDHETSLSQCSQTQRHKRHTAGWIVMVLLIPSLYVLLHRPEFSDRLILGIGVLATVFFLGASLRQTGPARRCMLGFLTLLLAAQSFWLVYQLIPMALTLFVENNVDRQVYGFAIPTGWVQNLNTITIIVFAPILAWLFKRLRNHGLRITVPVQFSLGIGLVAVGLLVLPFGIAHANAAGLVAFGFVSITYFVQAIAELCINPVAYAMVGRYIPPIWQSLAMGMLLLNAGVAAVLASFISNIAVGHSDNPLLSNAGYSHTFNVMGWSTLLVALTLLLLLPLLHRLLQD
jgi:proton-dependent oligopeptide transporter, POT family